MKALAKYVLTMSDVNCVYRLTVLELCKRGFHFRDAKRIVKSSGILSAAEKSWKITRDLEPKDWANMAIDASYSGKAENEQQYKRVAV